MANAFLYGVGGGKSKPEQEKNIVIRNIGVTEVVPDDGMMLSKASVSVGLTYTIDGVTYVLSEDGANYIVDTIDNNDAIIVSSIDNIPVNASEVV